MAKELLPNVFQLRVPLPNSPLEHLNAYLIQADGRCLLIDTGVNHLGSYEGLLSQLCEASVRPQDITDVLLTHFHIDHVGLIPRLKRISRPRIMLHLKEVELSKRVSRDFDVLWEEVSSFYEMNGTPSEVLLMMRESNPGLLNPEVYAELSEPWKPLKGEEELLIGDYVLRAIWTPGHSPGHVCLYEPRKRFLIAGDHVLPTITPHVAQHKGGDSPLADYLESLRKIEELDVRLVLPAHEEIFTNLRERVRQIMAHHEKRAKEILDEIRGRWLTAYQIAPRVKWDVDYPSWEEFPAFQKYLAVGETLAHLRLLKEQGLVKGMKRAGTVFYSAA